MAPPLDKYTDSREDGVESKAVKMIHQISDDLDNSSYCAARVMSSQIKELQQNASSGAVQMESERLKAECKRSMQMVQQWKKLYNDLQTTFVNELLNGVNVDGS